MDEVSAHARLADEGLEAPLVVTVPRSGIEQALEEEGADLVLDVVRTNGKREERRVTLALDQEALRRLIEQGTDPVAIALDPESLAVAFDDVEAHGLREIGATVAIAVAAVGGGAGLANAAVDQGTGASADPPTFQAFQTDFPSVQAPVVEAGMPRAMPADYAAAEQQMPRAMPSDYAAADDSSVTLRRDPGAMPTGTGVSQAEPRGIENIRAAQPPPAEAPDPMAGIESVRVGGSAVPDATSGIENVRAERAPAAVPDDGTSISAPSTGAAVAIAGGAMLTIAAAAFALRRKREPRPA